MSNSHVKGKLIVKNGRVTLKDRISKYELYSQLKAVIEQH